MSWMISRGRGACGSLLLSLLAVTASCASTPKQPTTPSGRTCGCPVRPLKAGAQDATRLRGATRGELLDLVPSPAVAALVVRYPALKPIVDWLEQSTEMHEELVQYFQQRLGVDITTFNGLVVYSTTLDRDPAIAALLTLPPDAKRGSLLGRAVGVHRETKMVALNTELVAARVEAGLLIGHQRAVELGIDLAKHKVAPVGKASPLSMLREIDASGVELLGAANVTRASALMSRARMLRISTAGLTYGPQRQLALQVTGDPGGLKQASAMIDGAIRFGMGLLEAQKAKRTEGDDLLSGAAAIVAYHQARELLRTVKPKLVDERMLMISATLPALGGAGLHATVGIAGVAAAIAIPAFVKYRRRAKAQEAQTSLHAIRTGLVAYYESHAAQKRRFRWPASTGWSPATSCCATPSKPKCEADNRAFAHPSWKALGFSYVDPHYYRLKLTSGGRGSKAWVEVEAQGDLDCDGKVSSYKLRGVLGNDGRPSFEQTSSNEIE